MTCISFAGKSVSCKKKREMEHNSESSFDEAGRKIFNILDSLTMMPYAAQYHESESETPPRKIKGWYFYHLYPNRRSIRESGEHFKWFPQSSCEKNMDEKTDGKIDEKTDNTFSSIRERFQKYNGWFPGGTIVAFCSWLDKHSLTLTQKTFPDQVDVESERMDLILREHCLC